MAVNHMCHCPSQTLVSEKSGPDTTAKECLLRRIPIPVIEKNPTEEENNTDILHSFCKTSGFEETVNALNLEGQLLHRSQRTV